MGRLSALLTEQFRLKLLDTGLNPNLSVEISTKDLPAS